ncbi:hypothetical protein MU1_31270 [Paenibacillus glycanilyticus]|uniref:Uncharacterized protein n=1 Tax=Paenibacillus glycanilyticus TaxID=126569 RepID=A0ABQ6GI95_9BACL|nr:hypothetical protein MU1_31270 [Paenibacillus glycanilyticus]
MPGSPSHLHENEKKKRPISTEHGHDSRASWAFKTEKDPTKGLKFAISFAKDPSRADEVS